MKRILLLCMLIFSSKNIMCMLKIPSMTRISAEPSNDKFVEMKEFKKNKETLEGEIIQLQNNVSALKEANEHNVVLIKAINKENKQLKKEVQQLKKIQNGLDYRVETLEHYVSTMMVERSN
jgi:peptidoglycan hydrolase CwlO-like protein